MLKRSVVLFAVVGAVAACGKGDSKTKQVPPAKLDKPEKVAELYYAASKAKDVDKMWSLYSKNAREGFTEMMHDMVKDATDEQVKKRFGVDKKQVLAKKGYALWQLIASSPVIKADLASRNDTPFTDIKAEVKGNAGKVFFSRGAERCRMAVVKEDGGWLMKDANMACKRSAKKKGDDKKATDKKADDVKATDKKVDKKPDDKKAPDEP